MGMCGYRPAGVGLVVRCPQVLDFRDQFCWGNESDGSVIGRLRCRSCRRGHIVGEQSFKVGLFWCVLSVRVPSARREMGDRVYVIEGLWQAAARRLPVSS